MFDWVLNTPWVSLQSIVNKCTPWDKVFKSRQNKICGRQPLKNFLKTVFHKFYLFHSWIFFPIYFFHCIYLNMILHNKRLINSLVNNFSSKWSDCREFLTICFTSEAATGEGVLWKNMFFKNLAEFTRKHLCQSLFFKKFQANACSFIKKDSGTYVFLYFFSKFLRPPFLQNTSGYLLLFTH